MTKVLQVVKDHICSYCITDREEMNCQTQKWAS